MVRRWCLLWTVVLLQGCSAIKLGYNQLPTLGHWWLDSQLSLEDAQSEPVRQALLKLQRWHRDQELLLYADLLSKLQGMGTRDLEAHQVCEVWTQIDDGANRLLDQAIRLAAPITLELKPRQLRHLARHWEKKNEDWENDWLSGNAQERIERRLERSVSRFSDFYGSLSPANRAAAQPAAKVRVDGRVGAPGTAKAPAACPQDAAAPATERHQRATGRSGPAVPLAAVAAAPFRGGSPDLQTPSGPVLPEPGRIAQQHQHRTTHARGASSARLRKGSARTRQQVMIAHAGEC